MKIGINGLGRIGRVILRQMWECKTHICSHINDINCDIENIAYLIRHDSIWGKFPGRVNVNAPGSLSLQANGKRWDIQITNESAMKDVDWSDAQCLIDCSGQDSNALGAALIDSDVISHVLITHTFGESDFTNVFGVNQELFNPSRHRIISTSICDACAIAPVLKIISDECGVEQCFVTTLHPWLSYQNVMDGPVRSEASPRTAHGYYPLGRSSTASLIPKPTTVGDVLESLISALKGRIFALSYRVPTAVVASADISIVTKRAITAERLRSLLSSINQKVIRCSNDLLVSIDYQGETVSGVIDLRWLELHDEHFIKLVIWYDNEWGYSARVLDLLDLIG